MKTSIYITGAGTGFEGKMNQWDGPFPRHAHDKGVWGNNAVLDQSIELGIHKGHTFSVYGEFGGAVAKSPRH